MKKLVSLVLAVALIMTAMAMVSVAGASGEKITLTFLDISPREARATYYNDVFARYTAEKNPNVTIEYEEVPWDDAHTKVVTMAATNDLPDLLNCSPGWITEFKDSDWIASLDDYVADSGITDTFVGSMKTIFDKQVEDYGHIYIIPDGLTTSCIYVRADWIKETLGIEYTELIDEGWTWERYLQLCHELTDPEKGRYGISFRGGMGSVDRITEYMMAMRSEPGVMWANTDNMDELDYLYNTEEDVTLLNEYLSLYWDGCAPTDAVNWAFVEMVDNFCGGLTGTLFNDMEVVASILASDLTEDQWGVLPVPSAMDGRIFMGVNGNTYSYAISNQTEYKDEAWDVLSYLYEGTNNADYCKIMTLFPLSLSATEDPFFGEDGPMAGFLYEINSPDLWKAESTYGPSPEVTQIDLYDGTAELQKVLLKQESVEDFLAWYDDHITEATKTYFEENPEQLERVDQIFGKVEPYATSRDAVSIK
ncbi:MAG: extracellular solute-binding protein [Clostridia bacterium]|nr:extracellular solute-binding protein [Clostridia bacterium]